MVAWALRIPGLHEVHEAMALASHVALVGDMTCNEDCRAMLVNRQTDGGNALQTNMKHLRTAETTTRTTTTSELDATNQQPHSPPENRISVVSGNTHVGCVGCVSL